MPVKSTPNTSKLFTLRFRAKIILGFVAVLAILAVSMAFAYFGFERIAGAVASYSAVVPDKRASSARRSGTHTPSG